MSNAEVLWQCPSPCLISVTTHVVLQGLDWTPQKPGNEAAYADAVVFQEFVAVVKVRPAPCVCHSLMLGSNLFCGSS